MSFYRTVKLSNVVMVRKGKKPKSIDFQPKTNYKRLLQIDDLRPDAIQKYCPSAKGEVVANPTDVIIAWDGANAASSSWGLSGVIGSTLAIIRPNGSDISSEYLGHFVKSKRRYIRERCKGATIPHVDAHVLANLEIPMPPLPEQQRIAEILDRAEAIRAKGRAALTHLDELTQAIFLEMFGDPIFNSNKWRKKKLCEVGNLDRGVSKHRPRNDPILLGGPHPLVQTSEVANCDGYIYKYCGTYSDYGLRQSKKWPAGTLCITIAANIAKTGILKLDACFPDSIVGFCAKEPATVEYIRIWISFLQKTLEDLAPESAQKNINLSILRNLDVPFPPLPHQQEFARRIAVVEKLKTIHRASLKEMDALFASLQHRAFRGEL